MSNQITKEQGEFLQAIASMGLSHEPLTDEDLELTLDTLKKIFEDETEVAAEKLGIDIERCMERFDQYSESLTLRGAQGRALNEGVEDHWKEKK